MNLCRKFIYGILASILIAGSARSDILLELYTSEGCSACQDADLLVGDYSEMEGILPLSFHVDYWDYLGWKDTLARPEFSMRQIAYQQAHKEKQVFTPQMIIAGDKSQSGGDLNAIASAIRGATNAPQIELLTRISGANVNLQFTNLSGKNSNKSIMLASYIPFQTVQIKAGENAGKTMTYINVVKKLIKIADWDGSAMSEVNFKMNPKYRYAVFVQEANMGSVVFAKRVGD